MQRAAMVALKAVLVVIFLILLFGQVLVIPLFASDTAAFYPELAYLRWPGVAYSIAVVICVQIALVGIWMLLSMVSRDAIFRPSAFRVVDVIIGCTVVATVLVAVGFPVLVVTGAMNPGLMIMIFTTVVAGLAVALLLIVMRALLVKATELEHDLAEVV